MCRRLDLLRQQDLVLALQRRNSTDVAEVGDQGVSLVELVSDSHPPGLDLRQAHAERRLDGPGIRVRSEIRIARRPPLELA